MFPSEILILMSIEKAGGFSDKQLTRPIDVTGKYAGYLYDSLVSCGFLDGDKATGYHLAQKGREAIAEALTKQQTGVSPG
jgi:hypothetical protein